MSPTQQCVNFVTLYFSIILVGFTEGAELDEYIFNLLHLTRIPAIYLLRNVMKLISKSCGSHNVLFNRAEPYVL